MTHQVSAARSTFLRGRGFSSVSAIGGLGGHRTYVASVRHPVGNGGGVHGFSSQSLSNLGGRGRVAYAGYGHGYYGGYDCVYASHGNPAFGGPLGHYGPRVYDSVGSCGLFGGHSNGRGDGIHGVRINEKLLKPLHLGVDPQEHIVRNHEREEMKCLNNQFASFIDKVRNLEMQNKVLETKWKLLQEQVIPAKKRLEPYYEGFISNMRKQLECLLSNQEHLTNENAAIEHLVEDFKCKYEQEFKRRTDAENEFVLLKKDVDSISLSKSELEGKVSLLRGELEFRRCVYEEELALLSSSVYDTNILLQMDNSRDLDIDCIIKNVEAWYQNVARGSKEEVNALYENRFQELQQQRGKYSQTLKTNQQEIADLTRLIHKLQSEYDVIKKQGSSTEVKFKDKEPEDGRTEPLKLSINGHYLSNKLSRPGGCLVNTFQTTVCEIEQSGDCALKDARDKHIDLQTAVQKAKDDLARLLRDYHELLNTKLALDIEIATYKTLLEGEENRIHLGNPVCIDVIKPSGIQNTTGFPVSSGYGPVGGGYGGGYGMGSQGRCSRNYSSRSVGFDSRTVGSNITIGNASADAEFYPGRGHSCRNESFSAGTSTGIGRSSTGEEVGRSTGHGSGAGFNSTTAYGSVCSAGRGCGSRTVVGNSPDGGYPCGGYEPSVVTSFGDGGWGSRVVGCADNRGAGVSAAGVPMGGTAEGSGDFGKSTSVGLGASGGVCYSGTAGSPAGVCYAGPTGIPAGVCYAGPAGTPAGVCYAGPAGTPAGVCYAGPAGTPAGVCYAGPVGNSAGVCYPAAVRLF